jgi:RNA polymerase sigma-70 factor, ECF subfamily
MALERQLIEAARQDPREFAAVYEAYFDRIYAYIVSRVRDRAEAQDLTSEVFHNALANLRQFEWRGKPFAAWLFRIAANAIADHGVRRARERSVPVPEPAEDANYEAVEERARLFGLVRRLPEDQRRVIEMRFIHQNSIREIAEAMGRSEGAVKQLQFRGLETLRARMGEQHG